MPARIMTQEQYLLYIDILLSLAGQDEISVLAGDKIPRTRFVAAPTATLRRLLDTASLTGGVSLLVLVPIVVTVLPSAATATTAAPSTAIGAGRFPTAGSMTAGALH